MASDNKEMAVISLADALELYHDLVEQAKGMDQLVRVLRDGILEAMSARKLTQVRADGYEAVRQLRHHPPQIDEDRATEILQEHGRLEECQTVELDEEKARAVIEELFMHGALTKEELPYVYIKPTEALLVRLVAAPAVEAEEEERVRRAA